MAKRVKRVRLDMANGKSVVVQVKTTTEDFIEALIADLLLPAKVLRWEVL